MQNKSTDSLTKDINLHTASFGCLSILGMILGPGPCAFLGCWSLAQGWLRGGDFDHEVCKAAACSQQDGPGSHEEMSTCQLAGHLQAVCHLWAAAGAGKVGVWSSQATAWEQERQLSSPSSCLAPIQVCQRHHAPACLLTTLLLPSAFSCQGQQCWKKRKVMSRKGFATSSHNKV